MNDNERRNLREALFAWRQVLVGMGVVDRRPWARGPLSYQEAIKRHIAVVNW